MGLGKLNDDDLVTLKDENGKEYTTTARNAAKRINFTTGTTLEERNISRAVSKIEKLIGNYTDALGQGAPNDELERRKNAVDREIKFFSQQYPEVYRENKEYFDNKIRYAEDSDYRVGVDSSKKLENAVKSNDKGLAGKTIEHMKNFAPRYYAENAAEIEKMYYGMFSSKEIEQFRDEDSDTSGIGGIYNTAKTYEEKIKTLEKQKQNRINTWQRRGGGMATANTSDIDKEISKTKAERDAYLKSVGYANFGDIEKEYNRKKSGVAVSLPSGDITWDELYNDALKTEIETAAKKNEDFEEKSKSQIKEVKYSYNALSNMQTADNYDNVNYNIINGDQDAREFIISRYPVGTDTKVIDELKYDYLTDEERAVYNYIFETSGPEKASVYLSTLDATLRARRAKTEKENAAAYASSDPIGASIQTILQKPLYATLEAVATVEDAIDNGRIDTNSSLYGVSRTNDQIRATVEENIDSPVGKFFYRHGMNLADNTAAMALGGFGAGGTASKIITTGIQSLGSFSSTVRDASERGLSGGEAIALGLISAGAETFFESKAFDSFFDGNTLKKGFLPRVANHIKTELIGELSTEAINDISDALIAEDLSNWQLSVDKYMADGLSKEDALRETIWDWGKKYADIAGGTLFSSGTMAGTSALGNTIANHSNKKSYGESVYKNGNLAKVLDMAAAYPEDSSVGKLYKRYSDKGYFKDGAKQKPIVIGNLADRMMEGAYATLALEDATAEQKESASAIISQLESFAKTSEETPTTIETAAESAIDSAMEEIAEANTEAGTPVESAGTVVEQVETAEQADTVEAPVRSEGTTESGYVPMKRVDKAEAVNPVEAVEESGDSGKKSTVTLIGANGLETYEGVSVAEDTGYDLTAVERNGGITIVEKRSGMEFAHGATVEEAVANVRNKIAENGKDAVDAAIEKAIERRKASVNTSAGSTSPIEGDRLSVGRAVADADYTNTLLEMAKTSKNEKARKAAELYSSYDFKNDNERYRALGDIAKILGVSEADLVKSRAKALFAKIRASISSETDVVDKTNAKIYEERQAAVSRGDTATVKALDYLTNLLNSEGSIISVSEMFAPNQYSAENPNVAVQVYGKRMETAFKNIGLDISVSVYYDNSENAARGEWTKRPDGHSEIKLNGAKLQGEQSAFWVVSHELIHEAESKSPGITQRMLDAFTKMGMYDGSQYEAYKARYSKKCEADFKKALDRGDVTQGDHDEFVRNYVNEEIVADLMSETMSSSELVEVFAGKLGEDDANVIVSFLKWIKNGIKSVFNSKDEFPNKFSDIIGMFEGAVKSKKDKKSSTGVEVRKAFAGASAKTANYERLDKAIELEESGKATPEEIRQRTGWFKGYDGKWRFEIDDSNSEFMLPKMIESAKEKAKAKVDRLNADYKSGKIGKNAYENKIYHAKWQAEASTMMRNFTNQRYTLNQILKHPKLYAAYPELKNVMVSFDRLNNGVLASTTGAYDTIRLHENSYYRPNETFSTLLHEIQHQIQEIEGFAAGSNPNYWAERNGTESGTDSYDLYYRTAGEVEARDVESRLPLSTKERKNVRPDIDRSDVVFVESSESNGGPSFSEERLDNVEDSWYNENTNNSNAYNAEGGITNGNEDEFRRIQEEARKEFARSDKEQRIYAKDNEALRKRLTRVLSRRLDDSGYNSGYDLALHLKSDKQNTEFLMYESVDAQTFHEIFEIARAFTENGELVDLHDVKTTNDGIGYEDCKNFISDDGLSGFSITPAGDLISVFNAGNKRGFLSAISDVVKKEAKTLDCYASSKQDLMTMYEKKFGFKTASVMDYNMEYDHDDIAKNHEKPNVAFMVNTPEDVETKYFGKDEYDDAVAYRDSFVENYNNSQDSDSRKTDSGASANGENQIKSSDAEYLELAKNPEKNEARLREIVEEAVKKAMPKSLVVDKNGNLLKVYHGTSKGGFTVFDTYAYHSKFGLFGNGAYFTENRIIAEQYTQKGKGTRPQVYDVYLSISNPIDMDAKADVNRWNEALRKADLDYLTLDSGMTNEEIFRKVTQALEDEGIVSYEAEEIVRNLFESMGYNGITHMGGGRVNQSDGTKHRVWIAFYPEQIKSADTITYDDDGNIIPISERFKSDKTDIRYSLTDTGVYSLEDAWAEMTKKYGAIPKGEKAARDVKVPKKISDNKYVSRTARSAIEAGITPAEFVPELQKEILDGKFTYERFPDEKAEAKAKETIEYHGFEGALEHWEFLMHSGGAISKENFSLGIALYNQCAQNGDFARAEKILADLSVEATRAGQAIQSMRLLKKMSADGTMYYLEKSIDKINDELVEKFGEKRAKKVKINEELARKYFAEKDAKKREKLYDELCKDIGEQIPSTFWEKADAWRYVAMLLNPTTHIRNVAGNIFNKFVIMADHAVEGALQPILVKRENRTRTWRIADRKTANFAKNDWELTRDVLTSGEGKYNNMMSDIDENRRILRPSKNAGKATKAVGNAIGFVPEVLRKVNSCGLEAEDAIFLGASYKSALRKIITARKLNVDNITPEQLSDIRDLAMKDALRATFREANWLAESISKAKSNLMKGNAGQKLAGVALGGVFPFTKTPMNITKQALEHSPLGVFKTASDIVKKARGGAVSGNDIIADLARTFTGTGLAVLGFVLARAGFVSAGDDEDPDKKRFDKLVGEQSYAITIGGKSYTIDWATPASIPFLVGAQFFDATSDSGINFKTAIDSLTKLAEPVIGLSMLDGLRDFMQSDNYAEGQNPLFAGAYSTLESYALQFFPTLGGKIHRIYDGEKKNYYFVDKNSKVPEFIQELYGSVASKLPFAVGNFQPSVDLWGRVENHGGIGERLAENLISPGYYSEEKYTEVDEELLRLYESTGNGDVFPKKMYEDITIDSHKYYMNAEHYTEAAIMLGERRFDILSRLFNDEIVLEKQNVPYSEMSDSEKAKIVSDVYYQALNETKYAMFDKVRENSAKYGDVPELDSEAKIRIGAENAEIFYKGDPTGENAYNYEIYSRANDFLKKTDKILADADLSDEERKKAEADILEYANAFPFEGTRGGELAAEFYDKIYNNGDPKFDIEYGDIFSKYSEYIDVDATIDGKKYKENLSVGDYLELNTNIAAAEEILRITMFGTESDVSTYAQPLMEQYKNEPWMQIVKAASENIPKKDEDKAAFYKSVMSDVRNGIKNSYDVKYIKEASSGNDTVDRLAVSKDMSNKAYSAAQNGTTGAQRVYWTQKYNFADQAYKAIQGDKSSNKAGYIKDLETLSGKYDGKLSRGDKLIAENYDKVGNDDVFYTDAESYVLKKSKDGITYEMPMSYHDYKSMTKYMDDAKEYAALYVFGNDSDKSSASKIRNQNDSMKKWVADGLKATSSAMKGNYDLYKKGKLSADEYNAIYYKTLVGKIKTEIRAYYREGYFKKHK